MWTECCCRRQKNTDSLIKTIKVRRIQTLGNVILALVIALLDFVSKVIQIFVYEIRHSLARLEYLQGGQQQFFIIVFSFSMRYQTLISDIDKFILALFIVR